MSQFPFATDILFKGQLFKANELPRSYFPTLLALQLTEPLLLLAAVGVLVGAWLWARKRVAEPLVLFLAWFLVPVALLVAARSPLYDNGRQLYFLLPPLFVMAALALERLFAWLSAPALRPVVLLAIALPGVLAGAHLHPYEYIYYNVLTGGTGGAFRTYEMDYWGTSLKELTAHVNQVAPIDAKLLAFGPQQIVRHYARPDLAVDTPSDTRSSGYNYAMLLTREDLDQRLCKAGQVVYQVGRSGAVFSVLKSIPAGAACK